VCRLITLIFLTLKYVTMRTNKLHDHFNWSAGRWNNRLSFSHFDCSTKIHTIYVFTGISHKRLKKTYCSWDTDHNRYRDVKVIFVSNKQLMDFSMPYANMHFIQEARNLVFDGKIGTRYKSKSKSCSTYGSYFNCLRSDNITIQPYK